MAQGGVDPRPYPRAARTGLSGGRARRQSRKKVEAAAAGCPRQELAAFIDLLTLTTAKKAPKAWRGKSWSMSRSSPPRCGGSDELAEQPSGSASQNGAFRSRRAESLRSLVRTSAADAGRCALSGTPASCGGGSERCARDLADSPLRVRMLAHRRHARAAVQVVETRSRAV